MKKISMKKTVSTVLITAMLASVAGSAFAWVPSDTEDPKCIDIRNLNNEHIINLPKKKEKNVCGCKTCEVSVMTFDKIPEYLDKVEKELKELDQDIRTNENKTSIEKMEDCNKAVNISIILGYMKAGIEARNYLRGNVYLASVNNQAGGMDALGRFERHEGITYDTKYDEEYFNSLIPKIKEILKNRDSEDEKNTAAIKKMEPITDALQRKQNKKKDFLVLTGITAVVGAIMGALFYVEHLRQEGRINNKAALYIWEKLYGPLKNDKALENLNK